MTERIDHAEEARQILSGYPGLIGNRPFDVAQVHATLALVEQQRIANVISLHRHEVEYDLNGDRSLIYEKGTETLLPEIREALGID